MGRADLGRTSSKKLSLVDSGVSVGEYFNKFQENLRVSGNYMSDEDKITPLKDGLRPDIQKAVIFIKFDTVGDLLKAALEAEACDTREEKKIAPPHKTRLDKTSKPAKVERIDLEATVTEDRVEVVCEHWCCPGNNKEECWIYLARKNLCGLCQVSGHTIYVDCPQHPGRNGKKRGPPRARKFPSSFPDKGRASVISTESKPMKLDSSCTTSSAVTVSIIAVNTSQGTLRGIPDSGSMITLLKKDVHDEFHALGNEQKSTSRFIQSSEGTTMSSKSVHVCLE